MPVKETETDVLVVGGGLAGVRAALSARKSGAKVIIALKGSVGRSGNSSATTGGIAAAMNEGDSPSAHQADTLAGGYDINDPDLVRLVCTQAPAALSDLADMGLAFTTEQGQFECVPAPGHTHSRSVRYRAGGGWHLMRELADHVRNAGITCADNCVASDLLLSPDGGVTGGLFWNSHENGWHVINAGATVLAAGGCGQLYPITTNKPDVTGDAYALAFRAGCSLRDMEFIQFTPTAVAHPDAIRGFTTGGAILGQTQVKLYNADGERFMKRYDPENMEQAVRSVAARAIYREVLEGRGTDHGGVWLDMTALDGAKIDRIKPGLRDLLGKHGIDPCKDQFEIAPSAHYCMGGIEAGPGLSPLPRLFVAGEALGGTHGANRLSSNSLTEANVTGKMAGELAAEVSLASGSKPQTNTLDAALGRVPKDIGNAEVMPRDQIKEVMSRAAGLERSAEGIDRGIEELESFRLDHGDAGRPGPADMAEWLSIKGMLTAGELILRAAKMREESRGAHFRVDFPGKDDAHWQGNVILSRRNGQLDCRFRPKGQ